MEIVASADPRFADLNKGKANGRFPTPEQSASQVVLCHTGEDVAQAVEQAVHAGKRPTMLSGGHCYEDFVFNNPKGSIIDTRPMNGISQDAATKRWKIEAGATVGEMYVGLHSQGNVTIPAASCTTVGVGGHISGGGYGFLTRLYGVAPDWISAVDVVTVDAKGKVQLRHVNKKTDADLLRALRGSGGGSYGVVTAFYSDKPAPAPKEVMTGSMSFDWVDMTPEKLHRILYLYSNYWHTRGRDKDTWGLFTIMSMAPLNPANAGAKPRIGMSVQFCNPDGTVTDTKMLDEFFATFDELKPKHIMTKHNWIDATGVGSSTVTAPDGAHAAASAPVRLRRRKSKSAYMRRPYTLEEAQVFYKHLTDTSKFGGSSIAMDSFGGAASNQAMLEETSDAHRSSIIKMQFTINWSDEAEDAERMGHLDRFYTALFSASSDGKHAGTPAFNERTEGVYIGYPDADMTRYSYWPELLYGPGKLYPFLQRVKKKYDPQNIFHHAMSVRA